MKKELCKFEDCNWFEENTGNCENCDAKEIFKCRACGLKYPDWFCSTNDIGICRWCSGEEV